MFRAPRDIELKKREKEVKRDKSKTPVIPSSEFMSQEELWEMLNVKILSSVRLEKYQTQ